MDSSGKSHKFKVHSICSVSTPFWLLQIGSRGIFVYSANTTCFWSAQIPVGRDWYCVKVHSTAIKPALCDSLYPWGMSVMLSRARCVHPHLSSHPSLQFLSTLKWECENWVNFSLVFFFFVIYFSYYSFSGEEGKKVAAAHQFPSHTDVLV